ncbi:MAG: hypothetical protein ABI147_07185 [Acidobacteriaceae bacterium]
MVTRLACAFSLSAGLCVAAAQRTPSALPPTLPTGASDAQIAPLSATPAYSDAATRAHRAEVLYASGLLSINANNSSLNEILREISRQTGMKITGFVRDERVFGHYGPAAPGVILETLIDGTSTNMLLRQTASNTPEELILTPRSGGATPPDPNASGSGNSVDDNIPPQRATFPGRQSAPLQQPALKPHTPNPVQNRGFGPPSIPLPLNNVNGDPRNVTPTASQIPVTNSVPTDSLATPSTTPSVNGIVDTPNPPNRSPTTPNGVESPEDIFKQLQNLRQQQQQQQQSTTPPQ